MRRKVLHTQKPNYFPIHRMNFQVKEEETKYRDTVQQQNGIQVWKDPSKKQKQLVNK
jgi:hypothetical protein